ncbi:MAG TPA: NDP-sugar synthase [Polyangia bacterium]|jgi:NDP-sugar pyrophosphorylase family protein|nr:NDP-sugar synthase [Polyangia bacterium]
MNVMLLAAGRSTRLGALGAALPKPLVPICGYPAIAFGLTACARAGLARAVVNVFHHGDVLRETLGAQSQGVSLEYSVEAELLGTGGGLALARPRFDAGAVLVMNAKVVANLDLRALLAAHAAGGAHATMLLRDDPDARRWGAISADEAGRVVGILDARSPVPPQGRVTERMFTGIHVLEPALLDRLRPVACDVIRDAYIPALVAGEEIRAEVLTGYFAEHSTPERYLEGNLALLRAPSLLRAPPGPLVGVEPAAIVQHGARLGARCRVEAGAVIEAGADVGPDVVVGRGAHVVAGARLHRVVMWANTVATATLENAVVTPDGVVPVAAPV